MFNWKQGAQGQGGTDEQDAGFRCPVHHQGLHTTTHPPGLSPELPPAWTSLGRSMGHKQPKNPPYPR